MPRFLLIGLDGAEPSLLERWIAAGRLPHLENLARDGAFLRLRSTTPPATFPAWTTCVTGVNPGRHGIFDFTETVPGASAVRFVNATFRKAPALWTLLSAAGKRVGVLGAPATYPPERVSGFMVSGFDSPVCAGIDRSFVYPAELYDTVRGWRFADFQETDIRPGWHERMHPRLLSKIADKEVIAERLLAQEPWDFFMVVFGEADTAGHHFWMFHDPASPRHRPGLENALQDVYERLDAAVGRLRAAAGPGVTVAVVSDHGFGGAGTGVVHINNWLAEQGWLRFAPGGRAWAKRAALQLVPERWRGAAFRRFATLAARAESQSRFGGIDWANTRAWSEELNYFPSVRVNLRGREPHGQVAPDEYNAFCETLCERLEKWFPVRTAWRRNELYTGPHTDCAPDIVLELRLEAGYSYSCLRSRGGPSFRRIGPREYLGGKERGMNGNHRPEGVLLLSRPVRAAAARIEDVAPTVLAELGVPAPPMDGTALLGLATPGGNVPAQPEEQAYSPEQERAVEARLRDLGYLE